jgi:predicted unusual protein kinase regulating ubiquinone biosynthesis (AarF/ABC1/UbiB family)
LDLARPDPKEVQELSREFRDILFDFPFQIPQDFIYLGRALGMVTGLISQLDPDINPWYQVEKYGQELLRLRGAEDIRELSRDVILEGIRPYLNMPPRILRLLELAEKGRIVVQSKPDPTTIRHQKKMEQRLNQLSWSIVGAASMISASLLFFLKRQNKKRD